jgi:small multidrug resistance pump
MSGGAILSLGAAMAAFLAASAFLRVYAGGAAVAMLVCALLLYTVGNLMMVRLMREGGMAVAISVSGVLQLVLANLVAVLGFGERPTVTQLVGIALGVVAVALILLPAGAEE